VLDVVFEHLREQLPVGSERLRADLGARRRIVFLGSRWPGRGVYAVFTGGTSHPNVIVKVDFLKLYQDRLRSEWAKLIDLVGHRALNGRVPRPLALFPVAGTLVLAQSGQPGVPLNVALRRRLWLGRRTAERDHRLVAEWIEVMHSDSVEDSTKVDPDVVIYGVARAVESSGIGTSADVDRFAELAAAIGTLRMPLRLQHGDLGTSNILLDDRQVSVIDWEGTTSHAPPLQDVLVFLVQYARAIPTHKRSVSGWKPSFQRAFVGGDWLGRLTARTWNREVTGLGLPAEAAGYLLVATMADLASPDGGAAHSWNRFWRAMWDWRIATYLTESGLGGQPR